MLSYEDREYHRRRLEMELEEAISADDPRSALAHLELARMHRARNRLALQPGLAGGPPPRSFGVDKEA